jgi:hypothetical protein
MVDCFMLLVSTGKPPGIMSLKPLMEKTFSLSGWMANSCRWKYAFASASSISYRSIEFPASAMAARSSSPVSG